MCADLCDVVNLFANMYAEVCDVVNLFANMCADFCNVVNLFTKNGNVHAYVYALLRTLGQR